MKIIKGLVAIILFTLNVFILGGTIAILSLIKLIVPFEIFRHKISKLLLFLADNWVAFNNFNIALTQNIKWEVEGLENLDIKSWYLVVSNHQSWVDIMVLQKIFLGKIPFLKFFLKKQLIWVPILGPCWWGLDFPFMKRYTREFLEKNPHLKGKDLETTRAACEKFKKMPISVMNFLEGTRHTPTKHKLKKSPYKNLLPPKAGGFAFVLGAMGEYFNKIVDVTIYYPGEKKSFIDLIFGRIKTIKVKVKLLDIPKELVGDYQNDDSHRKEIQNFVNKWWHEKDQELESMKVIKS
ncbi:MAG: acyltransferase [Epsilonproteobacteria bacterium]|nr:MAG: acyltransferase [Campylobacterota bacterium]RLA65537.1 MAG: acyltransferase [Campylobacterota bacterium]